MILVEKCHHRGSCYKRQKVLNALFKDRRKVKPVLKEGVHCFQKDEEVLLGEKF